MIKDPIDRKLKIKNDFEGQSTRYFKRERQVSTSNNSSKATGIKVMSSYCGKQSANTEENRQWDGPLNPNTGFEAWQ